MDVGDSCCLLSTGTGYTSKNNCLASCLINVLRKMWKCRRTMKVKDRVCVCVCVCVRLCYQVDNCLSTIIYIHSLAEQVHAKHADHMLTLINLF